MTDIHHILRQYWGHTSFRPLQEDIIHAILAGEDTLALLPTGGGKSICFQIPALVQEGICLVISPLIALMKDQVYNLKKRNIPAAAIFSGMHRKEIDRVLDNCIYGNTKFLYLSPERLKTELFQERLKKMNVSFIAVDEAHCISQWGYDFRPSYLDIATLRNQLPNKPFLALTATATNRVKQDIQERLGFKQANVFQKSFTRANLSYSVFYEENKLNKLVHILRRVRSTGIVYARSRKKTQEIAQFLRKQRFSTDFYHAGLTPQIRTIKQNKWMQNKTQIIVCTNAFGMGIDKSDVRIVVHMDLPESLEAYYQEAGRGGRDGKRAYTVLLYDQKDVMNLEKSLVDRFPETAVIKQVYQSLGNYFQIAVESGIGRSFDFDLIQFSRNYQLSPKQVFHSLKVLEDSGFLTLNEALYMPSKLLFIVNKEELYRIQVANRRVEPYIKTVLRIYGGSAFDDYVAVNEKVLARHLKTSEVYVKNALRYMKQQKILNYIEQKEQPQITFIRPRIALNQLKLNQKLLTFLKEVRANNIKAVKQYVSSKTDCRSQQLVAYLGELDSPPCKVCDVCIQRKKRTTSDELFEAIRQSIGLELEKQEGILLPMSKLLLTITQTYKQADALKVIRWMREQKILVITEQQEVRLS